MMAEKHRKYDVVIFGASGFTGKFVVEELAKMLRDKKVEPFTWAVAGRSKSKLLSILAEASKFSGYDVTKTDIVEADIDNIQSIHKMAKEATVVINCVGPYRVCGYAVVKACIEEGTHHLDISGETQFLEKTQLLHHKEAEEKGVYVIGACGFDCIPSDIGVALMKKKFEGDLNSVEMYLDIDEEFAKKSVIHYGTWDSAINLFANLHELKTIRTQLFTNPLPEPKHPMAQRSFLHYSELVKGWCMPFLGTDKSVVDRTERYFYESLGKRPVQFSAYMRQGNIFMSILMIFALLFIGTMTQFRLGVYLLTTFPRFFTLGFVSHKGPTREQADFPFTFTLIGEGWSDKLSESSDKHSEKPNKKMVVKVRGRNPGYGATCICFLQSALTVLRESEKMPSTGGVYTPGAAFAETSIVQRLNKTGVTFEVLGEKELK